jgi:hypothetical protein
MPERTRESKVLSYGRRLAHLKEEREAVEAKEKKIREDLDILMQDGEVVNFTVNDKLWELGKKPEQKTVLKEIREIYDGMTLDEFLQVVSATVTGLKNVFGKDIARFISHYDLEYKLKLNRK